MLGIVTGMLLRIGRSRLFSGQFYVPERINCVFECALIGELADGRGGMGSNAAELTPSSRW